ncbi:c-type cytochrome domain-containing protein [Aureliella helgolandensis]|uniref:Planctomycete cytochrome C n=1 Tax=Aureliella helgolandensis TaxID=2527968 RepID=A0A518G563_9BACT|nr:c-type cytochrome domain-containing protein [Aureliella helgolandensis]QDV23737.1 Planctomycete cytochrome C [Aureliella helgolandensis]
MIARHLFQNTCVSILLFGLVCMAGCGGGEEAANTTASNDAAAATAAEANYNPPSESESESSASYGGGETYGGGSYGSGSNSGGGSGSSSGYGSSEDMYAGMSSEEQMSYENYEGSGSSMSEEQMYNESYNNYNEEMYNSGSGSGYGSGSSMYGSGGGMYGSGGAGAGAPFAINAATQLIGQNCIFCHGPQKAEGNIRLDSLSGDFENPLNAKLWEQVLEQLEAGTMPPAAVQRRPQPDQQQKMIAWLEQTLDERAEQDYQTLAEFYFSTGHEKKGLDYSYAHMLAADDAQAEELFQQARWYVTGKRPVTTLRFAVGIELSAPSDLTDVKPIGVKQASGGGGGGGYEGGYGGSGSGGGAGGNTARSFESLTGEFGEELVSDFSDRWTSGALGTVFNEVVVKAPATPTRGGMNAGGMNGSYGMSEEMYSSGGSSYGGGGYGSGSPMGAGTPAGSPGKKGPTLPDQQITPGLIYVGTGSHVEMMAKAAEVGATGLFLFEVTASVNRVTRLTNNETRLRVFQIDGTPTGKPVGATRTLKNTEIEMAERRGNPSDDVEKNIDRMFAQFDTAFKLDSLPTLPADIARKRMVQLLSTQDASRFEKLFEARLYHTNGWLTDQELSTIYQIILEGNEGQVLAQGLPEDRQLVMQLQLEPADID